ncbi:MAG: acetylxylan esterase [candidate division KSB1 bacterium]|nr:acetylxylan esterase [candidate division KSB1 bacterium]
MKRLLTFQIIILLCCWQTLLAQQPRLPANYPPGMYDESKVPSYTLPDPLVMLNGERVSDTLTWKAKRRPEIIKLFETHVYGRTMVGRPKEMTWEVTSEDRKATGDSVVTRTVTIYFVGKKDGPKMNLNITLPVNRRKPVPIFLVPGWDPGKEILFKRGYGLANFNPWEIEPDRKDSAYVKSIRKFFAPPGQMEPQPDEWGCLGAWAWATSRAMDYLESDPAIDASKVCVMGLSRYGKVAMWAGAQDERFAIVFSCESGCGGSVIVRRGFGETVKAINDYFPHWFCGNFKTYGDRVNELPVDWHELVALMAPRPVYIATAEEDYWADPRGSFLAGKNAEPVYKLFGKSGLGVAEMPPVETPVGHFIGFHMRKGGHGLNEYDWEQFLDFADRHFGNAD